MIVVSKNEELKKFVTSVVRPVMHEELNSFIAECNDIEFLEEICEWAKDRQELIKKYGGKLANYGRKTHGK